MTPDMWVKASLVAVPLAILATRLVPGPGRITRVLGGIAIGIGLAVGLSFLVSPGMMNYLAGFGVFAGIYAILTLGLNIQWGGSGLLNFGIAAFFALGAFTSALVTTEMPTGVQAQFNQQAFGLNMPFLVGVLAGGVVSGIVGWVIARATLQLRLDYLAIATIGIAEIVRLTFQNEGWLANGPDALGGIPQPFFCLVDSLSECALVPAGVVQLFAPLEPREYNFIYLALIAIFVLAVYAGLERIMRSPWGRVLRGVRENPDATAMSGKDVASFKIQAFVVGAVVMGIGGALYAHHVSAIDYSHFRPLQGTFLIWVMLMMGGSGNNRGALLGGILIFAVWSGTQTLTEMMRPFLESIHPVLPGRAPYLRFTLIALILMLIVIFRPQGILPEERQVSTFMDADDAAAEPSAERS